MANNTIVKVIVTHCTGGDNPHTYGEQYEEKFSNLVAATLFADSQRGNGMSVLIRPTYNEVDENGKRFFREWLSMNNEVFKERRFDIPGSYK